jgi:hypothetical protein
VNRREVLGAMVCVTSIPAVVTATTKKEQSSCSEWTGIPLQTEHCCEDWEPLKRAFGSSPAGSLAWVGLRWCGGWRRANL